jgi:hypothetical protein
MEPNRQDFASTVTTAYVNQYGTDTSRRVINEPRIDYDPDNGFSSTSTLNPSDGIEVLTLEEGMFGSEMFATDEDLYDAVYDYLMDDASNDLWSGVLFSISEAEDN